MIVDSQVHVWAPDRPDRPWPRDSGAHVQRATPLSGDELLVEMDAAGVDAAILVPPAWEGQRNDVALAAAARHPSRFAVMGRLPSDTPDCRDRLREAKFLRGLLGLRVNLRPAAMRARLEDGTLDWLWEQAEADGLKLMVYTARDLPRLGDIAARHPGLRIAVDHMGIAAEDRGMAALQHLPDLIALARHGNIAVKASALPCVAEDSYPYRSLHDPVRRVFDAFGPARLFWGTDLTRLPCSYRQAVTLFTEELPWLSGTDRDLVMGDAICRWLDWHPAKTTR